MKTTIILLALAGLLYAGYKFFISPIKDKQDYDPNQGEKDSSYDPVTGTRKKFKK